MTKDELAKLDSQANGSLSDNEALRLILKVLIELLKKK